ncbi:MAG TPA: zinc-ribbon domain containing protein [Pyrinomonadaceae bacterium]|nr:zinc-ribbon domain containing protein [Pyrinomonadaceae bacterium]HNU07828.1 zinc-ribbon domain containing protein [Pyrinomonadaceae bacterium]
MPDIEITCVQCKEVFLFGEKEQEIFYQRNMMTPQRCQKCRSKRAGSGNNVPARFEIVCDHCGKHDHVPFQPKVGRSVLCRECYNASRSKVRMA